MAAGGSRWPQQLITLMAFFQEKLCLLVLNDTYHYANQGGQCDFDNIFEKYSEFYILELARISETIVRKGI
jgi:hypothetical protein